MKQSLSSWKPLNPCWCGSCIMGCMIVIKADHNTADTLINANHLFGSTILAFLTKLQLSKHLYPVGSNATVLILMLPIVVVQL